MHEKKNTFAPLFILISKILKYIDMILLNFNIYEKYNLLECFLQKNIQSNYFQRTNEYLSNKYVK